MPIPSKVMMDDGFEEQVKLSDLHRYVSRLNALSIQVANEELKLHLEEELSLYENLDELMKECLDDFPDNNKCELAQYAARIARNYITDGTRTGHARYVFSAQTLS